MRLYKKSSFLEYARYIAILLTVTGFIACDKQSLPPEPLPLEPFPPEQSSPEHIPSEPFELGTLQKILDGYIVNAIDFDSKGNAWIGTINQGIIRYNEGEIVLYNTDNSIIPNDFIAYDIAIDKNDNVWIGGGEGLLKFDGEEFTLYNSQNTAMPEDLVQKIEVDSKNNIWFASCRFRQGGLVKYDGIEWTAYTPDNSALPDNLINDIAINQQDDIWLTVNNFLVKFSDNKWEVYDKDDLGLTNFIFAGIQFNSKNSLIGINDHSFNGSLLQPPCELYNFDGKKAVLLSNIDNLTIIPGQTQITIDHNDNIWCIGLECGTWIGNQWTQFDRSEFGGLSIWAMKEAPNHRIWFGTENGIYIR